MSTFFNSLDFTFLLEIKTCFRDPYSFAAQVPKFSNRIKVHLCNTVYPVINSAGCSPEVTLLSAVSKRF